MNNGKIYNEGESPSWILKDVATQYLSLRTGVIEEVDVDKYEMTVRWAPGNSIRNKIPIPFPYAGPAGCIGMLPEKGAMGIFGFNEGKSPLCIGFLPAGLDAGLNYNQVKVFPDAIPTSDINEIQFKFRKLSKGDMVMRSPLGATVFLNEDVEIHDEAQDSIVIREADQSIISTSLNHFVFADGVSINSGPAIRNAMVLYNEEGEKIPNNGSLLSLPNGKDNIYIVPHGEDISYDTPFYTEYRVDVDEMGDGKLDLNDINSMSPLSTREPIVSFALGNYIGADRKNPQTYGEILKVNLFSSPTAQRGNFGLEASSQKNGIDEPSTIGLAYALNFPNSGCFLGVDKEGHYSMHLPASKSNPLGSGRSMSILAAGNLKEIWGPEGIDQNSWDLTTVGGIRWNVGSHGTTNNSRSIDIKASRGIYIKVNGSDDETVELTAGKSWTGFSRQEIYKSNVYESVGGGKRVNVSGEFSTKINGMKEETIDGSSTESVQSDKNLSVGGVYSETVSKEKQSKFGSRKTTIAPKGNDELEIMAGDLIETISTFGQRKVSINLGNIKETIGNGVHETEMILGTYKLSMGVGKLEIKSPIGMVTMEGSTVTIKGSLLVKVDAPMVKLGSGAPIGGALTGLPGIPSCFDPITGAPFLGSYKVSIA